MKNYKNILKFSETENNIFEKIIIRANDFIILDNKDSQEMLKIAFKTMNIDMNVLYNFDIFNFLHDIKGLIKYYNFQTLSCDDYFLPRSVKKPQHYH